MNVWIIDDDLVSRFATQYGVKQFANATKVAIFDSAFEVLLHVKQNSFSNQELPDIMLLDLVMPEMNGWEFLKELKKIGKIKKNMRIYILSAFSNYKDRTLAKEHPLVHGYFDKPLSRVSIEAIFSSIVQ